MKVVVTGLIATYPVGGVFWDYIQYMIGFEKLGFEVYYLEDAGYPALDPVSGEESEYGVSFLKHSLDHILPQFKKRWHYRSLRGDTYGLAPEKIEKIVSDSDIFLNVSGSCLLRDSYMACRRKVLIDTDPGWNHFYNYPKWDNSPGWQGAHSYRDHDIFFTYAENIGCSDCLLPSLGIKWKKTRPLVVMENWKKGCPSETWTTVMSWNNYRRELIHNNKIYGSKEKEFPKFDTLPNIVSCNMEIAVGGNDAPRDRWRQLGWSVINSLDISKTADDYRSYIQSSRGEFSIAKNVYVDVRSGWFSCRSICYMSSGLPVILQDTGFSKYIPTGTGVLAFATFDEAAKCINKAEKDYELHCQAAHQIAKEYFSSEVILYDMLDKIGL